MSKKEENDKRKEFCSHLYSKYPNIQKEHIFLYIVIGEKTEEQMVEAWNVMPKFVDGKFQT